MLLVASFSLLALCACDRGLTPGSVRIGGSIRVNSSPAGASIWLDDSSTGQFTNCSLTGVVPGVHAVKLKLDGYGEYCDTVIVVAGQPESVDAVLFEAGSIFVNSNYPRAYVWLDGVSTKEITPCRFDNVPVGLHDLSVRADLKLAYDTSVVLSQADTARIAAVLLPYETGFCGTGMAVGVSVDGHFAYVAAYTSGLWIVDISEPAAPRQIGHCGLLGQTLDVATDDTLAYVAVGEAGLNVVSVSDPQSPRVIGSMNSPGDARGVAVSGSTVYLADGDSGLSVVNVADPVNPHQVGRLRTPGSARGLSVAGDFVYIAAGDSGLRVICVTDPANPYEVGHVEMPGDAYDVTTADGHAYVADGWYGMVIVDVSEPTNPRGVSNCWYSEEEVLSICVHQNLAYVAAWNAGLRIVDVTDPGGPFDVAYCDLSAAVGVSVSGAHAYVARDGQGLSVVAISKW